MKEPDRRVKFIKIDGKSQITFISTVKVMKVSYVLTNHVAKYRLESELTTHAGCRGLLNYHNALGTYLTNFNDNAASTIPAASHVEYNARLNASRN